MKELSIEEKAKRYELALERCRKLYNEAKANEYISDIEDYEIIFPELKESEDERIRKELIEYFRWNVQQILNNFDNKKVLTWLEKQGKNNMGISEATKQELEDNLNKALEKETSESCNEFLEKQGEQKPADKVEPKFKDGDKIISTISNIPYYITEVCNGHYLTDVGCIIMFNAQDNFELVEQKPAWSEEDEKCIKDLLHYLEHYSILTSEREKCIIWLKSLKDRVQLQNTWKPSDEQMLAINTAVNVIGIGTLTGKRLIEIQEQLKKLKEE